MSRDYAASKMKSDRRNLRPKERDSKERRGTSRRSGDRRKTQQRTGFFDFLKNPRTGLIPVIFMVVVIFYFQTIHEARLLNRNMLKQQEREQNNLRMMEENINNIVSPSLGTSLQHWEEIQLSKNKLDGYLLQGSNKERHNLDDERIANIPKDSGEKDDEKPMTSKQNDSSPLQNPLIPESLNNLADSSEPYSRKNIHIPFFWHIAKSGGTTIKHLYSDCYGLVEACESGIEEGHLRDITLKVVTLEHGWKFLNVDTTTPLGIERASRFNIIRSGKADLVVSPLPHAASSKLFVKGHKGRIFTVFRDPIHRVVSLFRYLQKASHEPTFNAVLQNMTLEQYAFSELVESNFVTRSLIDKMEGPLEERDFEIAREIIKSKVIVGLLDKLQESIRRFELYFEFGDPAPNATCKDYYIKTGSNRQSNSQLPQSDSPAYLELHRKNHMDLRLYEYAVELFGIQGSMFNTTA